MRNTDLFDDYLMGNLNAEEKKQLENRLQGDAELKAEFGRHKKFVETLQYNVAKNTLKSKLKDIHTAEFGANNIKHINSHKSFFERYIKPTGFAASVAVIAVVLTITSLSMGGYLLKKQNSEVEELSKRVEYVENKQDGFMQGVKAAIVKNKKKILAPANTTGSGFAINSKGYFVTCLHIVRGSDSIFIGNKSFDYASARIVYTDTKLDIAILKLDSSALMSLNWNELPYAFKASESDLAEKAFTLGYPSQDIVYGEGTISSSTRMGDTAMYQISIPVNEGNSGGPLIDEQGNVIGVINSKKTNAEGTGFAAKSSYLAEILKGIEDEDLRKELTLNKRNSIKGLKRSEQVKRITPFVFNVYVYK
ncbi:MAG: peptidase and chymotrypsin/Hap [Bacteroidetes bacterium]|jgi:S1-C subfamily serine protease|nr:peptidase and chymotrypsin/Hap [Bacteroidota bacterium]